MLQVEGVDPPSALAPPQLYAGLHHLNEFILKSEAQLAVHPHT